MINFFRDFDNNAFWINMLVSSIFFIISIPVAIKLIPHFTISLLRKKNGNFIVRKKAFVIQELCEYINEMPFSDNVLKDKQLAIFTSKKDLDNYQFVALSSINIYNPLVFPRIQIKANEEFEKLTVDEAFLYLTRERDRLDVFRTKLEAIIDIHSLHIDDIVISEISDLCLEIRSFDIRFKQNYAIDDLIEQGYTKRIGISGKVELYKIYESILILLKNIIDLKKFDVEIENKPSHQHHV